jgi:serine/threonine protein kinase
MSSERWKQITPSQFPWEREALDYVRERLPDIDPYRAWANFEFIADDGTINEVDLLVLTPRGFFLVEIKSRPGILSGDRATWVWESDGRSRTEDNPIILTNRKAKKLISLLKRQKACQKIRVPYLDPLVFCSHETLDCRLQGVDRYRICLRDSDKTATRQAIPGIIAAVKSRNVEGVLDNFELLVDRPMANAISRGMEQAGIRPSQRSRRVGDYVLGKLLFESPTGTYQDWEANHSTFDKMLRRVRIYTTGSGMPALERDMIRRAAKREFELLEGLSHTGILQALDYTEHELGPAIVFRHDPDSLRLDHFLAQYGARLSVDDRLSLTRQVAEALRYAHEKRVVHRALSPQSVLVTTPESQARKIKIFNWQTGQRLSSTTSSKGLALAASTLHPEQLIEDAATVYMAPEAITEPGSLGEHMDVFSLGAITYHVFSGQPPAGNLFELSEKLRSSSGLAINSIVDGAAAELQELIQFSTYPSVSARYESVAQFLEQLDKLEDKLTTPEKDSIDNPLDARVGDKLDGGFLVRGRLGSGSSAVVMLVEKDGTELVLKLASKTEYNERVREEAAALRNIRHQNIVQVFADVEIGGLAGFTMERAGDKTLAQRLRLEGRLHLDMLERFGEELIQTVRHLEQVGTPHRDIKPDNIGVRPFGKNETLGIVLFDFSLSRTPITNIRAGTTPYLEPFLAQRKPPRWDIYAERYAVAVTLYEMATGKLPCWGDGQSDPALLDCEVSLNTEFFDPDLRESMEEFFAKALQRDYSRRFDNSEEMLRAWRQVFAQAEDGRRQTDTGGAFDHAAAIDSATPGTQIVLLGLSTRANNALDRLNVVTVRDLLQIPLTQINRLRGVGNKTRREIAGVFNELRLRFPDVENTGTVKPAPKEPEEDREAQVASVDLIAEQLKSAGVNGEAEKRILHAFLGFDQVSQAGSYTWRSQTDTASRLEITRARVSQVIVKARERWKKNPSVSALRDAVDMIVTAYGGAMTVAELSEAVLTSRGSVNDEPVRSRLAAIVTRAAVETESSMETPRFVERRSTGAILVARDGDHADYAENLGRNADRLADSDPVLPPARILEALRAVQPPPGDSPISETRLVRLASAASTRASVSSRMELYPRGMAASRVLKLAHGALLGAHELTVDEIRKRVAARYPEGEPLPERPELDQFIADSGLEMTWNADAANGNGAYVYSSRDDLAWSSTSTIHARMPTILPQTPPTAGEVLPEIADARLLENKLQRAAADGTFLALTVVPKGMETAERELVRRFHLQRCNIDEILIRLMRDRANAAKVDWSVVLQADGAAHDSQGWRNLMILVGRCIPLLEKELTAVAGTALLVFPGLLGRYDQLEVLRRLRDKITSPAGSGGPLRGLWVLLPADDQNALPTLDRKEIPVISSNQWARIPDSWLTNRHRSLSTTRTPDKPGARR